MSIPRPTVKPGPVTCPAGVYYVGDPCYAASDDTTTWAEYGESSNWFQDTALATTPEGKWCVGFGTAYGDGVYVGNDDFAYGVDAGLIGVVPEEYAEENALRCMRLVTFPRPFECYVTDDGVIFLGHIIIDTDPEDEDEDEDGYEYEEDEDA